MWSELRPSRRLPLPVVRGAVRLRLRPAAQLGLWPLGEDLRRAERSGLVRVEAGQVVVEGRRDLSLAVAHALAVCGRVDFLKE